LTSIEAIKPISEKDLIHLLVIQDKKGMEYLYDNYSSALYGVILRIVKSEDIAEEILHDCFLRIWNKIVEYDSSKGKLFTWMVNIARNLSIDKIRSKDFRNQHKSEDIENNVSLESSFTEAVKPEYIGVREILDRLNPDQKQVLDLMYFQGYSQSEISEEYGIPLGTVKTRVRAAMEKLRKIF
jgi:RNA polymerase sigma-70 factor (ECF subfamily)